MPWFYLDDIIFYLAWSYAFDHNRELLKDIFDITIFFLKKEQKTIT